ncbi:MAG: hypothetical protein N2652_04630 [Kiritimatiellae bacterium]|nr:hypothetical protein [Kiritimatiellia bacterium]
MNILQIGGIALAVVVVGVGAVASRTSVRSAVGPRERAFARRVCLATWTLIAAFVLTAWYLPRPANWVVSAGFVIGIPWAVYRWTTQRQLIRELDLRETHARNHENALASRAGN